MWVAPTPSPPKLTYSLQDIYWGSLEVASIRFYRYFFLPWVLVFLLLTLTNWAHTLLGLKQHFNNWHLSLCSSFRGHQGHCTSIACGSHHVTIVFTQRFCLWFWFPFKPCLQNQSEIFNAWVPLTRTEKWDLGWFALSSLHSASPFRHWIIFSFLSSGR